MRELVNKFANVLTKPGKPVAPDIKYKIEFLDPEKPIPYRRLQRMTEREFQKVKKSPERVPRERLDTA